MKFAGKIALVTGGATGLGFAIAEELVSQGARVVVTGRRQKVLDDAVAVLGEMSTAVQADVSKLEDLGRLFSQIRAEHGRLDVLVANAGKGELEPLGSITEASFDRLFDTNVKGVVFTVQHALPLMSPGGSIVIVGSTASISPGPGLSVYGATKAALRALVRSWVLDIKGRGIRINLLSPGPVNTPSLRNMFATPKEAEAAITFLSGQSTIGRIGEPEEIGRAVAFLASDAASYVNGSELFADGGASQV
jgi:NAD(P)-dependent dehydrogenase (short-subunit alcohol dehydrogenase family)